MIDPLVDRLKGRLTETLQHIDQVVSMRQLVAYPEWRTYVKALNSRIIGHVNRLCDVECPHDEANRIRGQILTLREVATIADRPQGEIDRLQQTAQHLRGKMDKLHTHGHLSAEERAQIAHDIDEQLRNLKVTP